MALGINQTLLASDIMEVRDLKGGKIFLLSGRNGDKLVLKAEDKVTGDKIKAVSPVIKTIDPSAKMKPLMQSEVMELQKFVVSKDKYIAFVKAMVAEGLQVPISAEEKESVKRLKACLNTYGTAGPGGRTDIAKMVHAQMSTLAVALKVDGKPSDDGAWDEARGMFAKFARALRKSGGFEKLGQIVAGDFFIGNLDRFSNEGEGIALDVYGGLHKFKVIYNLGNIILVKPGKGKRTRMSMLDYMDPNTVWLRIDQDLTTVESTNQFGEQWPMRVLLDKASRRKLAEDLVEDLNFLLKPEKSRVGFKFGGSHSVKRVEKGMVQGIKGIAKALKGKQAKLSPLLKSYYQEIQKV